MSITQKQIEKLSKNLNKISLESNKLQEDIVNILQYINLLSKVNTKGVKVTINIVEKENILREDKLGEKKISRETLLNCSQQSIIQDQIAISNIM